MFTSHRSNRIDTETAYIQSFADQEAKNWLFLAFHHDGPAGKMLALLLPAPNREAGLLSKANPLRWHTPELAGMDELSCVSDERPHRGE